MTNYLYLLISTVLLRPYVFIFFACYLFLAITHIGWKRTVLFTVAAYTIAFICEWSSAVAGTGIPFGLYRYLPVTIEKELWIAGVPFMDSLSFTFLSYNSWELATLLLGRLKGGWADLQVVNREQTRRSWSAALLASFLMMYLDIVIDPVALRGDRWFLGKIYYYPDGGVYFGVTLANFIGWYIVCFVIIRVYLLLEKIIFKSSTTAAGVLSYRYKALGPLGLYLGVLGFNLFMTFRIGELFLGVVGAIVILPLAVMILLGFNKHRIQINEC
ncbi:MAG: carotenoid biosynthesis protein [Blastocatellia bacterium]|nr:carotenoid biosynthesis protein [Blastocatellia bacterium]